MTPSAGRGTCSATRGSAPTRTCTPSATPSARGRGQGHRRRRLDPRATSRTRRPPGRHRPSTIRFNHRVLRADWSTDEARWRVTAERTDTGETFELTCGLRLLLHRLLPLRPRLPAGLRRHATASAARIVHPQAWPEDLDYAGKRVVVIGSGATAITLVPSMAATRRARDHAAALAHLRGLAARPWTRSPTCLRRVLPPRLSGPAIRWFKALTTQAFYVLSRRRPGLVKRLLRRRLDTQLPAGYDVDTHFTPRYNPWDQRLCVVPDGDLFKAIRDGTVVGGHRHHRDLHRGRPPARLGRRARGRRHRDRHRARAPLPRRDRRSPSTGSRSTCPERLVYKGMMLEDVPNLAVAIGLHQRLVDPQVRPHLRLRLPPAEPPAHDWHCASARRSTGTPPPAAEPLLGLTSGYVLRAADRLPQAGRSATPGGSTRATCATTGRSSAAASRTRRWYFPTRDGPGGRRPPRGGAETDEDLRGPRRRRHRRRVGHRAGPGPGAWPAVAPIWRWPTSTRPAWPRRWPSARATASR